MIVKSLLKKNYMSLSYYFKYYNTNLNLYNFVEYCDNNNISLDYTCIIYPNSYGYEQLDKSDLDAIYIVAFNNLDENERKLITIKDMEIEENLVSTSFDVINIKYDTKHLIISDFKIFLPIYDENMAYNIFIGRRYAAHINLYSYNKDYEIWARTLEQHHYPNDKDYVVRNRIPRQHCNSHVISDYSLEFKHLKFENNIKTIFGNDYKILSIIKCTAVRIYCGWVNNALPHENIFPSTVKTIIFGVQFSDIINTNCLPHMLEKLTLVNYKHKFQACTFPIKLKSLIIINYQYIINNLPINLQKLYIGNNIKQQVILPNNLSTLYLGSSFTKALPSSLKKISCKIELVAHYPKVGNLRLYYILGPEPNMTIGTKYILPYQNELPYQNKLPFKIYPKVQKNQTAKIRLRKLL
jgi:hypothetical protein